MLATAAPEPEHTEQRSLLGRADLLLSAFDEGHQSLSLAGLAARTGLPRTTAYRMAERMVLLGWLARRQGRYRIGRRLFEVGMLSPDPMALREAALPFMEDLYEATHGTVHLTVRDGTDVFYAEKIAGHTPVTAASRIGGRLPIYATGVGKALLAHSGESVLDEVLASGLRRFTDATCATPEALRAELDATRRRGVAIDSGEYDRHVRCVAAPVHGPTGVLAAISVADAQGRTRTGGLGDAVRVAALGISRALGQPPARPSPSRG
jgi:DNA-binding IclR family transcriptional regulator